MKYFKNNSYDKKYNIQFVITLEYTNKNNNITNIFRKLSGSGSECLSTNIHPLVNIYDNKRDFIEKIYFDENIFAEFLEKKPFFDKFFKIINTQFKIK